MSFFRLQAPDDDPQELLDPDEQRSEPWGGADRGRCDKCGGEGEVTHECESCQADGPRDDCPACGGRVRYRGECPACEGTGHIDDTMRRGVSVFPEVDGLYRYMLKRDADLDGCLLVELDGEESEDEDFDADEGALLIRPTAIVDVRPVDDERVRELRRELAGAS